MSTKQQATVAEVLAALEANQMDLPALPDMASKINNVPAAERLGYYPGVCKSFFPRSGKPELRL
jgi:hypothetical protein